MGGARTTDRASPSSTDVSMGSSIHSPSPSLHRAHSSSGNGATQRCLSYENELISPSVSEAAEGMSNDLVGLLTRAQNENSLLGAENRQLSAENRQLSIEVHHDISRIQNLMAELNECKIRLVQLEMKMEFQQLRRNTSDSHGQSRT
jgi:hypothetical protein